MSTIPPQKSLTIWSLLAMLIVAAVVILLYHHEKPSSEIAIDTKGQPTLGSEEAEVQVIAFEEPKCPECKLYNDIIFPQIKQKYIDTGKIQYTVIPVSFLHRSKLAAVALLSVYHQDPEKPNADLFYTYLDYMYRHQPSETTDWATTKNLLEMAAQASSDIDLQKLEKEIKQQAYLTEVKSNTDYGAVIMKGSLATPTIYVEGEEPEQLSMEAISKLIDKNLAEQGKQ